MDLDRAEDYEVSWTGVQAHDEAVSQQRQAERRVAPVVLHRRRQGQTRAVLAIARRAGETGCTMAEAMRVCDLDAKQASGILSRLCDDGELRRRYAKRRGEAARWRPQIYVATALASSQGKG